MPDWHRVNVKTGRGSFVVFVRGHGPPMCVTHGYSAFNETGDYFAARFTAFRTVYLVNLRGAGRSPLPDVPTDLGMARAVEDLDAIRAALGLSDWDFAGHSTGGMLGLVYAVAHPSSLSSLIVVGTAASRRYNQSPDCIYHPGHPQFLTMQALIESLKNARTASDRLRFTRQRTELSLKRPQYYDRYFDGASSKQLAAARLDYFSQHDYPEFDVRANLPNIWVRTLVVGGRHDVQCRVPRRLPVSCPRRIWSSSGRAITIHFSKRRRSSTGSRQPF